MSAPFLQLDGLVNDLDIPIFFELPPTTTTHCHCHDQALLPSARYERRVGVSLVRAAWERRPEGPAYLLPSVTLLYLAGLCAF